MGWTVVKQTNVSKTVALFEYKGKMQGQQLHWYAHAEKVRNHVYLVTGTAKESQWGELSQKLRACVDSFRPDNAK